MCNRDDMSGFSNGNLDDDLDLGTRRLTIVRWNSIEMCIYFWLKMRNPRLLGLSLIDILVSKGLAKDVNFIDENKIS